MIGACARPGMAPGATGSKPDPCIDGI